MIPVAQIFSCKGVWGNRKAKALCRGNRAAGLGVGSSRTPRTLNVERPTLNFELGGAA